MSTATITEPVVPAAQTPPAAAPVATTPEPKASPAPSVSPAATPPAAGEAAVAPVSPPVAPAAPYVLTVPEGAVLDPSAVERVSAFALESKLEPATAQKVLEAANTEVAKAFEQQKTEYVAKVTGWETAVKADKDLGGANFTRTLTRTTAVLDRFAKDGAHPHATELRKALNTTGFGNYPPFVWLMEQIGASMENDRPNGVMSPVQDTQAPEDKMFPSSAGK